MQMDLIKNMDYGLDKIIIGGNKGNAKDKVKLEIVKEKIKLARHEI